MWRARKTEGKEGKYWEKENIFLAEKKEKEQNIWKREIFLFAEEKNQDGTEVILVTASTAGSVKFLPVPLI